MKASSLLLAAGSVLSLNGVVYAFNTPVPGVVSIPAQRRSGLTKRGGTVQSVLTHQPQQWTVDITLGTPPQTLTVQIDTGSSDLVVNAPTSNICSKTPSACVAGLIYSANASSTYRYVDSTFIQIYEAGDGGTGDYAIDVVGVGGASMTGFEFGIAYNSSLNTGVLGVGYVAGEAGYTPYDNLPVLLVKQGFIASNVYSLYLNDITASTGTILFGGVDTAKYIGSLAPSPFIQTPGYGYNTFNVLVNTVTGTDSNGNTVSLTGGTAPLTVLLDSGADQTILPATLAAAIWSFVGATAPADANSSPQIACSAAFDARKINFAFSGITISVPLRQLVTTNGGDTCDFNIVVATPNLFVTIGDSVLTSMYVVYDLDNNLAQIGAANPNAASSNIVPINAGSFIYPQGVSAQSVLASTPTNIQGGIATASSSTTPTTATTAPVPTSPSSAFKYAGCYSGGLLAFSTVLTSTSMTIDICLAATVSTYTFAAVNGNNCYGSNNYTLSAASLVPNTKCNIACPGKQSQFCGGSGAASRKRQNTVFISVYQRIVVVAPPATSLNVATPTTLNVPGVTVNVGVTIILNGVPTYLTVGQPYVTVVTTVYLGIGPTGLALTTTTSIVSCTYGCTSGCAATTIPMVTVTQACPNCAANGGPATVTVKVPATVATQVVGTTNGTSTVYLITNGAGLLTAGNLVVLVFSILLPCFVAYL